MNIPTPLDENKAVRRYLSKAYQNYVRDRYNIHSNSILYDDNFTLLLYAAEWFNIPDNMHVVKIRLHPYLTIKDDTLLSNYQDKAKKQTMLFFGISIPLLGWIFGRGKSKVKTTFNFVKVAFLGTSATGLFYYYYAYPTMLKRVVFDKELSKYSTIDIDKTMVTNELKNYGIVQVK